MKNLETRQTMKSVLVVDDNVVNRKLAVALLNRRGMHVQEADGGEVALALLNSSRFDAVLLDISMPVMDGKEVCRIIRADPHLSTLWVVAYTAHAMESERQSIMAAGFDDLLVKPISAQDLLRVLPD
jgi:CheY-like chemotaxis protein